MKITLREIAKLVEGEIVGNPDIVITGISGIKEARAGDITFLANSKYTPLMNTTKASAIITSEEITNTSLPLIKTENPSLAFTKVMDLITPNDLSHPKDIHHTAIISSTAKLSKNVNIGAYSIIEDKAEIGEGTIIYGGCYIGHYTKIGNNCLIYPRVTLRERIDVGNRVIIHSGTVIGCDGFGFARIKGIQKKIPQIGIVVIEDDVEIGANVTVARARFDRTIIGKGTKIDNLVQIAHNVIIGENCIIIAQTGISGSATIGDNVILAGQSGVVGHINIGTGAIVAGRAGVTKSVPAYTQVSGFPAKPHTIAKRVNACVQNLPQLYKKIKELEKKVNELDNKLKKGQDDGKTKNYQR